MALVTLTIRDTPEGDIDIQAHAEPYIPTPDSGETPTPAQTAALLAIAAIHSAASMVAVEEEPERPQLHVVGEAGTDAAS